MISGLSLSREYSGNSPVLKQAPHLFYVFIAVSFSSSSSKSVEEKNERIDQRNTTPQLPVSHSGPIHLETKTV